MVLPSQISLQRAAMVPHPYCLQSFPDARVVGISGPSEVSAEGGGLPVGLLVGGAVAALAGVGLFMANQ